MAENQLGSYGPWAATHLGTALPGLSYRREEFRRIGAWRKRARTRMVELLAAPDLGAMPAVRVDRRYEYDGLHVEELSWQLPAGPRTKAIFLKPAAAHGCLPAVLALHDHGGRKYFGQRKIVRLPGRRHPLIAEHQQEYYGDRGWANEIARRGYAVLVHDGFLFGSRRIRYADVPDRLRAGLREGKPESAREVHQYNAWSGSQEPVVASALFCAGTTWPRTSRRLTSSARELTSMPTVLPAVACPVGGFAQCFLRAWMIGFGPQSASASCRPGEISCCTRVSPTRG